MCIYLELVVLPVDDEGGDVLVYKQQDGGQDGWDDGRRDGPQWDVLTWVHDTQITYWRNIIYAYMFRWNPCLPKSIPSDFGRKTWTVQSF